MHRPGTLSNRLHKLSKSVQLFSQQELPDDSIELLRVRHLGMVHATLETDELCIRHAPGRLPLARSYLLRGSFHPPQQAAPAEQSLPADRGHGRGGRPLCGLLFDASKR